MWRFSHDRYEIGERFSKPTAQPNTQIVSFSRLQRVDIKYSTSGLFTSVCQSSHQTANETRKPLGCLLDIDIEYGRHESVILQIPEMFDKRTDFAEASYLLCNGRC